MEIIDCDEAATEVIIPEEINGLPVTHIGDEAFYSCEELVMVKMPDTITSTGTNVFQFCYSLKNVELSESLAVISSNMFNNRIFVFCQFKEVVFFANFFRFFQVIRTKSVFC